MDVSRRLGVAVATTTLVAGSMLAATATVSAADAWPVDSAWVPVQVSGAALTDGAGDPVMHPSMDIVGDSEHPAAYVYAAGSPPGGSLAFRLRVDGNPLDRGIIRAGQWVVQLSTNEDPNAYDMAVMLQGGGAQRMVVFENTDRQCCTDDPPETWLGDEHLWMDAIVRVTQADTSYSGTPDYFLEWKVPADFGATPLTGSAGPVRFLFGTSVHSDGTLGNGEVAGSVDGQTAWEPTGSDLYARSPVTGSLVRETTPPTVASSAFPAFVLGGTSLAWSGADPDTGIVGFDLSQRTARWNTGLGVESAVLLRSTLTSVHRSLKKGSTACYTVRSINGAHLLSAWTAPQCTARPVDQGALSHSRGWRTVKASALWGGTAKVSSQRGASLTLAGVRARRLALVATTCPSCGKVDVLLNGVSRGVIDLRSPSTMNRRILELPPFDRTTGKLQLKVVSANKPVKIDAVGISSG